MQGIEEETFVFKEPFALNGYCTMFFPLQICVINARACLYLSLFPLPIIKHIQLSIHRPIYKVIPLKPNENGTMALTRMENKCKNQQKQQKERKGSIKIKYDQ